MDVTIAWEEIEKSEIGGEGSKGVKVVIQVEGVIIKSGKTIEIKGKNDR